MSRVILLSSPFVISTSPDEHEIGVGDDVLKVWVKPLSWIEQQEALTKFVEFSVEDENVQPTLDFGGYWKYILHKCIVDSDPKLSKSDLNNLRPEVGVKLSAILPNLTDLMTSLGGESAAPLE